MFYPEITGNILSWVAVTTGTPSKKNEKDLPVIFKYANALASTCKEGYKAVNHPEAVSCFLSALKDRFGLSCEEYAAQWNSLGARKLLWQQIKVNQFDAYFRRIQEIYAFAASVQKEVIGKNSHYLAASSSKPLANMCQTTNGFILAMGIAPQFLSTPFGRVELFKRKDFCEKISDAAKAIAALFIKNLELTFIAHPGCTFPITRLENNHTYCSVNYHVSLYEIGRIGEETFSERAQFVSKNERSQLLVDRFWELLTNHALDKDVTYKELSLESTETTSEPIFKGINEVIAWADQCLRNLSDQPFTFTRKRRKKRKQIGFKEERLGKLWADLYTSVTNPHRIDYHYDPTEKVFRVFCSRTETIDLSALESLIYQIFEDISLDWSVSSLEKCPALENVHSEEEWSLFTKHTVLCDWRVAYLLNGIISVLGIERISSSTVQKIKNENKLLALWIRKDRIQEVKALLGISEIDQLSE